MTPSFKACGAGLALLLAATPALAAQDAMAEETVMIDDAATAQEDEMAAMAQMFGGMFPAEPLTPDQQSRLPQAQRIIARIIPEGTMGELMDTMMNGMLGPIMAMGPTGATTSLAKQIGAETYALDLTDEQAGELASLFDPAWAERQKREKAMIPVMMKEVMGLMEPGMRKAMAELYAIRFSAGELAEIDAFFATTTGGKYARESFLMGSDPRIMAASMEALPALMGVIGSIEARMAESTADLPPIRSFAELSPAEKAKVAEATGYTVEDIEANLSAAQFSAAEADAAMAEADAEMAEADAAMAEAAQ